ncbi:MAG: hypothetical protein Q7T41_01770 [Candidatus Saccharibacteria bacterium]|nr:hypothetical protein [Candidatus Saccharibacteria bacterium]
MSETIVPVELPVEVQHSVEADYSNVNNNNPELANEGFLPPETFFDGLSEEDRNNNAVKLSQDTRVWLSQVKGIDYKFELFADRMTDRGKMSNGGVFRASVDLADAVNYGVPASVLHIEKKDEKGYLKDAEPLSREDYDTLVNTAPNEGLKVLARLLKSTAYPYEDIPDGAIQLNPRPAEEARNVLNHGDQKATAILCGRAEGYFVKEVGSLKPIEFEGEVIAYQKRLGEDTALLSVDAVINGVLIPKGSIITVGKDKQGNDAFSFARLSAFTLSSPQEIEASAPYITGEHNFSGASSGYSEIMKLLGNQQPEVSKEQVVEYLKELDEYFDSDPEIRKIVNIVGRGYDKLKGYDEFIKSIGDMHQAVRDEVSLLQSEGREVDFNEADKKTLSIRHKAKSSINPRVAFDNSINNLTKMFGISRVNEARKIIRDREIAERVLRVGK